MVTLFYKQTMIKKWVIMNFSKDLTRSLPVGQCHSSHNFLPEEVTSYEFYDDFGAHFSKILDVEAYTEVVAVLTISNVWVMCSLVLM